MFGFLFTFIEEFLQWFRSLFTPSQDFINQYKSGAITKVYKDLLSIPKISSAFQQKDFLFNEDSNYKELA